MFGKLTHPAELIKHDLQVAVIPYQNAKGEYADLHSLRHSYITALAMSGASVKTVQSLARHSTPTLTFGVYAHAEVADQTNALDALAGVSAPRSESKPVAGMEARIKKQFALSLPYREDGTGHAASEAGETEPSKKGSFRHLTIRLKSMKKEALDASCRVQPVTVGQAEGEGFEPPEPFGSAVFKTAAIDHSATPPEGAG